ncbi:MAG: hypothetical protein Q4E57_11050 [Eubacteriales bacterium]|nr:hypothetical protein [Eubacteriales bacterium]
MDKQNKKHSLYAGFKKYVYELMEFFHCLISVCIIIAIVLTLISLPQHLTTVLDYDSKSLIHFLEYVINVIIAIELIHVLLHQSLDTIVDVLSLAITRELIIEDMATWEMFLAIAAIALLFVIRKYLYISSIDTEAEKTSEELLEKEAHDGINKRKVITHNDERSWSG